MIPALALFIFLDQITKAIFAERDFFFIGIHFHPMQNEALPFGLDFGNPSNFFVLFIAYVVLGFVISRYGAVTRKVWWGKIMFIAGASANLVDRIMFGYVRDFIDLQLGFVFNLADVFIVIGLLMVLFSKNEKVVVEAGDGGVEKRPGLF